MSEFSREYYFALYLSYAAALACWWMIWYLRKDALYVRSETELPRSWKDVGWLLLCGACTIAIGRLYVYGIRFPKQWEAVNQILIYLPFIVFLFFTRNVWLPKERLPLRLGVGIGLAVIAMIVFWVTYSERRLVDIALDVFHLKNTHHFVQIFLEDLLIVMLLAAFERALGVKYVLIGALVVSFMFAFGHLPARLEGGAPLLTVVGDLSLDAILACSVCFTLCRARDFIWFFPVHAMMDMMQFWG